MQHRRQDQGRTVQRATLRFPETADQPRWVRLLACVKPRHDARCEGCRNVADMETIHVGAIEISKPRAEVSDAVRTRECRSRSGSASLRLPYAWREPA